MRIEPQERPGGNEPVFVSVNGINMLIPRAQTCWIDYRYYEALKNAEAHMPIVDQDFNIIGYRKVPEYPVSVFLIEDELPKRKHGRRMNFLELAQMTAQQSGTIQGVLPTTVTGQANRLKLVADLVAEAYLDIQNAHRMWRWMTSRFVGRHDCWADDLFRHRVLGRDQRPADHPVFAVGVPRRWRSTSACLPTSSTDRAERRRLDALARL